MLNTSGPIFNRAKSWALLGLALPFFGFSAAASKLHPRAERLKQAGNQRMAITRYSGHPAFFSLQSLGWDRHGDKYFEDRIMRSSTRIGFCESYLATQQKFPLYKYVETAYIDAADVPTYLRLGEANQPEQVNFLQTTRDVPRYEAQQMYGNDLEYHISNILEKHDSPFVPIVTASMWSVAGQALNVDTGNFHFFKMPWQRDPERAELAKNFDRRKYKIVWEWGRTAQDLPKEAEPLASVNATINYLELLAIGADLKDAYIMFHSLDEVNTRAYSLRFPGSLYPQGWTNKKDALFLVPLAQVLKAFPPSLYSGKISRLIELSQGRLNDLTALEFLQAFHRIHFTQLDVGTIGRPHLIAIQDRSISAAIRRIHLLQEFGFTEDVPGFAEYMMSIEPVIPSWNSGQYDDVADVQYTGHYYQSKNAIEISNLHLTAALWDKRYIERTLIAAFVYNLKTLMDGPYNDDRVRATVQGLRQKNVRYGISTFEDHIAQMVLALKPVDQTTFRYETAPGQRITSEVEHVEWISKGYSKKHRAFLFTIDQILEMIEKNPDVYAQSLNSAREHTWARHLMLSNPDVF